MHLIYYLAAGPQPHPSSHPGGAVGHAAAAVVHHAMKPETVFVVLLLALVIDWMSIGPNSIRDRIAWMMALPAIYEGFGGGPAEHWTVGELNSLIASAKRTTGGSYIMGVTATLLLSGILGVIAIWTIGVLIPEKFSKRLGGFARLSFGDSTMGRLNTKLWFSAVSLGLFADLAKGVVGDALHGVIGLLAPTVGALPNLLFGM